MMKSILAPNQLESAARQGSSDPIVCPTEGSGNGLARLEVVVDWARGEICHRGGRRWNLSVRETALLACLARKAGTPVSRDEILAQVWNLDPRRTATRTIDMHVSFLRRKLEDGGERPRVLITIHGVGYMLHRSAISCDHVPKAARGNKRGPRAVAVGMKSLSVA